MKKFVVIVFCMLLGTVFAFDRDFSVSGSGKNAPRRLQVFRRGKGYTFVLESAKPAKVMIKKAGKMLLTLSTLEEKHRLSQKDGETIWFLPDSVTGVKDTDFLDVCTSFIDGKHFLPDVSGEELQISGRKGREYSWNDENGTILEQISNSCIVFSDPAGDITQRTCGDLLSGKAETVNGNLILTAVLRDKITCNMRVWIDSIPEKGYSGDGTDFMLDNHRLTRFAGDHKNQWKWQIVSNVSFRKNGNTCIWTLPLEKVRPHASGRLKVRFQTLCPKANCGDYMPGHGKILPVLRPGNLASEKGTVVSVSSLHPQYKIYPLTDGQTSRRIHWCFESFAAGSSAHPRFAEFSFDGPKKVRMVTVWWESFPKKPALQILDADGKWKDIPLVITARGSESALQKDNETGAIVQTAQIKLEKNQEKSFFALPDGIVTRGVRVLEMEKSGSLWVREIEIY